MVSPCPICIEEDQIPLVPITHAGLPSAVVHAFHASCILPWVSFAQRRSCPLDRQRITHIDGVPLDKLGIDILQQEPEETNEDTRGWAVWLALATRCSTTVKQWLIGQYLALGSISPLSRDQAVFAAARDGEEEILRRLLGLDLPKMTSLPWMESLDIAVFHGHLACVRTLLENPSDPDDKDLRSPALRSAVLAIHGEKLQDYRSIVKELLATWETSPQNRGWALESACRRGDLEMAQDLLANGARVKKVEFELAKNAALTKGYIELHEYLLTIPADRLVV